MNPRYFKRHDYRAILIVSAILLTACNDNVTVQRWTDAMAASASTSAKLSWLAPSQNTDGTPLTDISGYHVYVGNDPNSLATVLDVADGSATSYTVSKLTPGTWYFAISAYTTDGVDGELSNVGSKTIA